MRMKTPSDSPDRLSSTAVTNGVQVDVQPRYSVEHSQPESRKFVFSYHVRISNLSDQKVQLLGRHWVIVDANGGTHEVKGEGVVGRQPELAPGENFEYASYCPLGTPWGTMEGTYQCKAADGSLADIRIARFYLVANEPSTEAKPGAPVKGRS
jgi:ApaG protein